MEGVEYQTHFGVLTSSSSSTNPQVSPTSVSATSLVYVYSRYLFSEMENIFGGRTCNAAVYEPQVGGVGEGQADR